MRMRKGVRLKAPAVYAIPSSEARGLQALSDRLRQSSPRGRYSGQSSLSATEQREEATTMSVALAQPHRENVYDTRGNLIASADDKRLGTALGRFCARHRPRPLAPWLEDAGRQYMAIVYRFKRAIDAKCIRNSGDSLGCALDEKTHAARCEKAEMDKQRIDDELVRAHRRGPIMMEAVCFDEIDPPSHWSGILVDCLLIASDHFGLTPKNIRDKRFDGP